MLFPTLKGKTFGYVNLNIEAQLWQGPLSDVSEKNPLLDPTACLQMIQAVHTKRGIDYSYGGWLEDRRTLWRGSYLDARETHIHLGVDFNVPAGTEVAADQVLKILVVDTDVPEEGGWGTRVIAKCRQTSDILIFAHLDDQVHCRVGDRLAPGDIFANVGSPPKNGGWYPHLHVQCVEPSFFASMVPARLSELDGYGAAKDIGLLARLYKDPLNLVSLWA